MSRDHRSAGVLRSVNRYLVADVSAQPVGPIFKGQEVKTDRHDEANSRVLQICERA